MSLLVLLVLILSATSCGGAPTFSWGSPDSSTYTLNVRVSIEPKPLPITLNIPLPTPPSIYQLSLDPNSPTSQSMEILASIPRVLELKDQTQPLDTSEPKLTLGDITCIYSVQSGSYSLDHCGQTGMTSAIDLAPEANIVLLGDNVRAVILYTLARP